MKRQNKDKYERDRYYKLRYRYGLSLEQYDQMFDKQNGFCAICKTPERAILNGVVRRLAVDHDHKTGKIRGLLCSRCNAILSKVGDSIEFFEGATNYLRGEKD